MCRILPRTRPVLYDARGRLISSLRFDLALMSHFKLDARRRAVRRGLDFIYRLARKPQSFAAYGSDLLFCFFYFSYAPRSLSLRRAARRMGRQQAERWRRLHPRVPKRADASTIFTLIHGSYAADQLGVRDAAFKRQLREAATAFKANDFLWFDPRHEAPPTDAPAACACGEMNERGRRTCRACRRPLKMLSRYRVWYDALTTVYTADCCGVNLGVQFTDVFRWLPAMRPYPAPRGRAQADFYDAVYAVTHVVYTLNDYDRLRLDAGLLPDEADFLRACVAEALETDDTEMLGELIDSLDAFGLTDEDVLIREAIERLLARQNADGSWTNPEACDEVYGSYHPTWTAAGGLLDIRWRGEGLTYPELKPMLRRWAKH